MKRRELIVVLLIAVPVWVAMWFYVESLPRKRQVDKTATEIFNADYLLCVLWSASESYSQSHGQAALSVEPLMDIEGNLTYRTPTTIRRLLEHHPELGDSLRYLRPADGLECSAAEPVAYVRLQSGGVRVILGNGERQTRPSPPAATASKPSN